MRVSTVFIAMGSLFGACAEPGGSTESWTRIQASVEGHYTSGEATAEDLIVELRAAVLAEGSDFSNPVDGATITIGPVGGPAVEVPTSFDQPGAMLIGWQPEYEIHAVVADLGIDVTRRVATPTFFTVAFDPIAIGQPSTVRWTGGQAAVEVGATLQTPSQGSTETTFVLHYGENLDSGTAELPATAFPRPGQYVLTMDRLIRADEDGADLVLDLGSRLEVYATAP